MNDLQGDPRPTDFHLDQIIVHSSQSGEEKIGKSRSALDRNLENACPPLDEA